MKFTKSFAALAAAALMSAVGSAQAYIQVNNWQINLGGIGAVAGGDDFTGFGIYGKTPTGSTLGVTQLNFAALFHAVIAGNPIVAGTLQHVDVAGLVTDGSNADGGSVNRTNTVKRINEDFELTFQATTTSQLLGLGLNGLVASRHLGAGTGPDGLTPNGYMRIYADVIAGAGDVVGQIGNASQSTGGQGMGDGFLIAEFVVQASATPTGSFNPSAFNGQDDATFIMTYNSGAVTDGLGNVLATGTTLAITDSNTDSDPDGDQVRDTLPTGWGSQGLGACGTSLTNTCGNENGSYSLANNVPEPGSLALLGIALAGMGVATRRRRNA